MKRLSVRIADRPVTIITVLIALGVSGAIAPAAAQPRPASRLCEPWVSHAFNNAAREKVDVVLTNHTTPADPCADKETAFQKITDPAALRVRLNEILIVRVQNLQTLWDRANCIDRAKTDEAASKTGGTAQVVTLSGCTKREIQLFIDGRPIAGLTPESGAPEVDRRSGTLRYHLERTAASKEHWADLLGLDLQRSSQFDRNVPISVGLAGGEPIPTAVTAFNLVRIRGSWLLVWAVLAVAALLLLYRAATRTDLLRDRNPVVELRQKRPFSLAQCQAAWWTALTLFAFVFTWLVTGQRDFSGSALVLLGITAGTVIGARVIDMTREGSAGDQADPAQQAAIQKALDDKKDAEAELIAAEAAQKAPGAGAAEKQRVDNARKNYDALIADLRHKYPGLVAHRSEGLFTDLLSDNRGVSFHRFQMLAWAVILGVMFAIEVLSRLAMPELEANLLALLGISSGTYLGLKIPEQS